jgi:hypothetical protein
MPLPIYTIAQNEATGIDMLIAESKKVGANGSG